MGDSVLSTLLTELPSFLSAVSMVGDDRSRTIQGLVRAEHKSPPRYDLARDLFLDVLRGNFTIESAFSQAQSLPLEIERKCAEEILNTSKSFLSNEPVGRIGLLSPMAIPLPNGMELAVSPVWIRHLSQPRLMVLHFWRQPLSQWQLSAAAAILISAVKRDEPECRYLDLDFISVAVPDHSPERRFRRYDWYTVKPLEDEDLHRFLGRLCDAWKEYHNRGPRVIKPRRERDLFDT